MDTSAMRWGKEKRHRSSSNTIISETALDNSRSERKFDIKVRESIPEFEDYFAIADARVHQVGGKIEQIKEIRRRRKLKKNSLTRIETITMEENPFIRVKTLPKKKTVQYLRVSRTESGTNPHLSTTALDHLKGTRTKTTVKGNKYVIEGNSAPSQNVRKVSKVARPDGDNMRSRGNQINSTTEPKQPQSLRKKKIETKKTKAPRLWNYGGKNKPTQEIFSHIPLNENSSSEWVCGNQYEEPKVKVNEKSYGYVPQQPKIKEERPVVELFKSTATSNMRRNLNRPAAATNTRMHPSIIENNISHEGEKPRSVKKNTRKIENQIPESDYVEYSQNDQDDADKKEETQNRKRLRRSHRYELPTVASQMKQSSQRCYYYPSNSTNIPFIVSKSTAPSHNIGVNLQQILNGIKIQQPLSGIPMTIAHHMGLRHCPVDGKKYDVSRKLSLDNREINVIKLGRRLLRLPSYKTLSYNRLLAFYREGEGYVPKFLRSISRPHYFYTSMYNLNTHRGDEFVSSTSKGYCGNSQDAKQALSEYANLYKELEQVEEKLRSGDSADVQNLERRRDALSKELTSRDNTIRQIVKEYKTNSEADSRILRASNTEDGYRRCSSFKLNVGDESP